MNVDAEYGFGAGDASDPFAYGFFFRFLMRVSFSGGFEAVYHLVCQFEAPKLSAVISTYDESYAVAPGNGWPLANAAVALSSQLPGPGLWIWLSV